MCSRGILSLAWLSLTQAQAGPSFPPLSGRVVDEAGVLSDSARSELDGILAGDEKEFGGRQIVVVTLKSLQGTTIEDYGYQLGRHWGIGQKGKNNGALVIVAPNEHAARIEVGYGLEGDLTDARSRLIIERTMLPAFRRGDYDRGRDRRHQGGARHARQHQLSGAALQPRPRRRRRAAGLEHRAHHPCC